MRGPLALIEPAPDGDDRVIALRGEIDVGCAPSLREWLARASDGGTRSVTGDLGRVEFMAVSGLSVLCDEQHRMSAHRARLTIVCDRTRILQLFAVCRLDDVLRVVPSRDRVENGPWCEDDDERAERLEAWLERYAAESA